jgi:hypothetical protein
MCYPPPPHRCCSLRPEDARSSSHPPSSRSSFSMSLRDCWCRISRRRHHLSYYRPLPSSPPRRCPSSMSSSSRHRAGRGGWSTIIETIIDHPRSGEMRWHQLGPTSRSRIGGGSGSGSGRGSGGGSRGGRRRRKRRHGPLPPPLVMTRGDPIPIAHAGGEDDDLPTLTLFPTVLLL